MFRLSEGLKKLEPENSSRLMHGLKFAREELILHQMKETQEALAKLDLKNAAAEQQQLLAKLERLQQLLLSTDLDFEMKIERLKHIRETLRNLNAVIKEESRQEKISKQAAAKEKELAALAKRRAAVEEARQAADRAHRQERPVGQAGSSRRKREERGRPAQGRSGSDAKFDRVARGRATARGSDQKPE